VGPDLSIPLTRRNPTWVSVYLTPPIEIFVDPKAKKEKFGNFWGNFLDPEVADLARTEPTSKKNYPS